MFSVWCAALNVPTKVFTCVLEHATLFEIRIGSGRTYSRVNKTSWLVDVHAFQEVAKSEWVPINAIVLVVGSAPVAAVYADGRLV